jgi:hypothetical protein
VALVPKVVVEAVGEVFIIQVMGDLEAMVEVLMVRFGWLVIPVWGVLWEMVGVGMVVVVMKLTGELAAILLVRLRLLG